MSIGISTIVWERSRLKGSDLNLLHAIADQANDEGEAWPARETLQQKARFDSLRGLQIALRRVEESKELKIVERKREGGEGSITNLYVVNVEYLLSLPQLYHYSAKERAAAKAAQALLDSQKDEPQFTGGDEPQFTGGMNHSSPETTYKQQLEPSVETKEKDNTPDGVTPSPSNPENQKEETPPPAPQKEKSKPRGKAGKSGNAEALENVARAAPFFEAWAEIAAPVLGSLRAQSEKRVKTICGLIDSLGADALSMFRDAATFVSTHPNTRDFWKAGGYGFDNLTNDNGAKIIKYAEAYAAQHAANQAKKPSPLSRRQYK